MASLIRLSSSVLMAVASAEAFGQYTTAFAPSAGIAKSMLNAQATSSRLCMTAVFQNATESSAVASNVDVNDVWVSEYFQHMDPAVVGPEKCIMYDTTLRGEISSVEEGRGDRFLAYSVSHVLLAVPVVNHIRLWILVFLYHTHIYIKTLFQMGRKWRQSMYLVTTN
jgi:hypothetical protein